jgi:hypothetical protein
MNRRDMLKWLILFAYSTCHAQVVWPQNKNKKQNKRIKRIKDTKKIHPRNKMLIKMGLMKHWKFHPNVPRLTADEALNLYKQGKAVFVLIADSDLHLIVGGYYGGRLQGVDFNRLVKRGQILVFYCP